MKKKSKRHKKKSKSRKPKDRKVIEFKSEPKRTDLKSVLQSIYHDTVSLETTCNHRCECCKVAMPQMNYSEFTQLINEIWEKESNLIKVELICVSLEYFFKTQFEKFGKETLIKPCMLLDGNGRCKYYDSRPLSCRMYGLWPDEDYKSRVDKFEKAYEGLLTRDELPLNTQCPFVKRVDDKVELTTEIIDSLYAQLDDLDKKIGGFSDVQVEAKENYRTFHDWLLLKIFDEEWLTHLTTFILGADQEAILDQLEQIQKVVRMNFANNVPDIKQDIDAKKNGLSDG